MAFWTKMAETARELDLLFQVRHQIFVEEMKYNAPVPGGRLLDRFDALPGTANLVALVEGRVVGGVRGLVASDEVGTPVDLFFDFRPHLPPGARVCAGSMLFVERCFRHGHWMTHALLGILYTWALSRGCTHVIGVAAPVAESLFLSSGYRAVTPRFLHRPTGLHALPVMLRLSELEGRLSRFVQRHRLPVSAERFERCFLAPGEELRPPNEPLGYFVLDGRLSLRAFGGGPPLAEVGPGQVWGGFSPPAAEAQALRAQALTPVELAVVERSLQHDLQGDACWRRSVPG